MAKRQVKPGIFQGSVGSEKDVMLGIKTSAGQSSGFLEQAAKVSPRKAAAVARSRLEEVDQEMDEGLQELELDIKSEDQATGRKEAGKAVLPEGERAVSPVYSDPLSPHPSETSPVESPLSTATSLSPAQKQARNPQAVHSASETSTKHSHSASETNTKHGHSASETSTKHGHPASETSAKRPPPESKEAHNPSKLMRLSNGEKSVVTLVSDVPEIPSVRPKRGPFHRGFQKARSAEVGHPPPPHPPPPSLQLPPTPVAKTATSPVSAGASPLDVRSSPLTRSSSAALKSVEFVSLPGRKRRRRGEEGAGDSMGSSSLDPVSPELDHVKSAGEGSGGGGVESPTTTKSERDTSSPVDTPQVKRKRGRPPKKRREAGPPNASTSEAPTDGAASLESSSGATVSSPESLSTSRPAPPPPPDTHSSPYRVVTPTPTHMSELSGRMSTPSPQTILAFEESPLPPAGSVKPSVEQSAVPRASAAALGGLEQSPVPFGKTTEPAAKATPLPAKPTVPPEINLPLWESFSAKPGSVEQKVCPDATAKTSSHGHLAPPPVQMSLKPSRVTEFGCVTSIPTIPSLLLQTASKTTPNHMPLHYSAADAMSTTVTPTTVTSVASSSPGSTPASSTITAVGEVVKRDPPPCIDQPDARFVKPVDSAMRVTSTALTSLTPVTPAVTPVTPAVTPASTVSCNIITAATTTEDKGESRNGVDQSKSLLARQGGMESQSESKEQRITDAHDSAAVASVPDGESPAKPEGEKAEAMGAEQVYLTKPMPSPPNVGYKPRDVGNKPLESGLQMTSSHLSSVSSTTKSGDRKEESPSDEKVAPNPNPNPAVQDPDSKSRSKIQEPDTITSSSMCYTLANPTAHYPPPTAYPPSSYSHYPPYPLVYPPGSSTPMYPPFFPPQQMPSAYLTGLHLPMSSEQTSGGFYATSLSQVTTRPPVPAPVATTVSGVRVAILDKPPPQLPAPQGLLRPPAGTSGNFPPLPGEHMSVGRLPCTAGESQQPGAASRGPQPHPHPLTQVYRTGTYNPFYPPYPEYVVSGEREPAPPPVKPAPPKVQDQKQPAVEEHLPTQPVECPECGRMFKNNKALNGHMRLHGGFDWTKKPFGMGLSLEGGAKGTTESKAKRSEASKNVVMATGAAAASRSPSPPPGTTGKSDHGRPHAPPKVFTFNNTDGVKVKREASESASRHHRLQDSTEHRNPTLDDLCRAVEELERKEKEATSDVHRHRPSNITIPQPGGSAAFIERERRKLSVSPPYTPPPILSPARGSMSLLASPQVQPHTPNRILSHWNGRRSTTDSIKPSDSEESSFMEPKINIGKEFQAVLPQLQEFQPDLITDEKASKVWAPIENLTLEEECTLDGYLELACSTSVPYGGRNKEYALHVLHYIGGSVKEAVRLLLLGKSPFPIEHHLTKYNYISTKKWTARERQQFRRAWRVHRKQFKLLRDSCAQVGSTKTLPEIIEHYYTWKKYRNDEYRCRNRHASEEILTDDDDAYPELHSSSSSGSTEQEITHAELHRHGAGGDKADRHEKQDKLDLHADRADQKLLHAPAGTGTSADPAEHLPVVYAPHTPRPSPGQPVHQYKCKYPGCNQVFTSIFALNGHIRIHGGSWYPKPYKPDSCSSGNSQGNSLGTLSSGHLYPSGKQKSLGEDPRQYHHPHYELTKVLSLEVPQPSGASYGMGCNNTPSPKPSPGKPRSPPKKKMSSSSPGEREGYYPCNRCGRVFTKVKSRSAHMKSHIIKQS